MILVDRFKDLHRYHISKDISSDDTASLDSDFMNSASDCQQQLSTLDKQVQQLRKCCDDAASVTSKVEEKRILDDIQSLSIALNIATMNVKGLLTTVSLLIKTELPATKRIQTNIHHQLVMRFKASLQRMQSIHTEIAGGRHYRSVRHIQIATPGIITRDEAGSLVSRGLTAETAVSIHLQTDNVKERLSHVNLQVNDIERVKESMISLRQCFVELASMVEGQSEISESIEFSIINAKNFMGQARVALKAAAIKQRQKMKMYLWLSVCMMVLLGCITYVVVGHVANASLPVIDEL